MLKSMDWLCTVNWTAPKWLYGPLVALLAMFLLWVLKRLIFYRLRKWAAKTTQRWDDILIEAMSLPMNFFILGIGIFVLADYLPFSQKEQEFSRNILQGLTIFSMVYFFDKALINLIEQYSSKKGIVGKVSGGITKGIIRGFVIGIGILIFLDLIGVSITPILASLGIGSLAVALALQDTLSNFFAGVHMAVDKPIKVGDFVKLENGSEGYVIEMGWRSTRIRTLPNNVVIVPNSKLTNSVITNFHLPDTELVLLVEGGVDYGSDLRKVETIVVEVARVIMEEVPGGVPGFEPLVRFHTFGDSSVQFSVVLRAKEFSSSGLLKHEFIKALHERFQKEDIHIPFPTRSVKLTKDTTEILRSLSRK